MLTKTDIIKWVHDIVRNDFPDAYKTRISEILLIGSEKVIFVLTVYTKYHNNDNYYYELEIGKNSYVEEFINRFKTFQTATHSADITIFDNTTYNTLIVCGPYEETGTSDTPEKYGYSIF